MYIEKIQVWGAYVQETGADGTVNGGWNSDSQLYNSAVFFKVGQLIVRYAN